MYTIWLFWIICFTCYYEIIFKPCIWFSFQMSSSIHLHGQCRQDTLYQQAPVGLGWWRGRLVMVRWLLFLKDNRQESDSNQIRSDTIIRELRKYKNGLRYIEGKRQLIFQALLRYAFHHISNFGICRQIALEVESCLLKKEPKSVSSIHELYRKIASSALKDPLIENFILQRTEIDEKTIPTLYTEYKRDFDSDSWKRICVFENHFSKECDSAITGYEEQVKLRWSFFNHLQDARKRSQQLHILLKKNAEEKWKRKAVAELSEGIFVSGLHKHIPQYLEESLLD